MFGRRSGYRSWAISCASRAVATIADILAAVLVSVGLPDRHRVELHSTNLLKRLNGKIKRRSEVVGIFPNEAAIIRLIGAVLEEQNYEWAVQEAIAPLGDDLVVILQSVTA
jgi:putative transposase